MINAEQAKEICERKASERGCKLFWIGEQRARVYRKGKEWGELLCNRPHFPIASKGRAYSLELEQLRNSVTDEIWQRFPSERA